MISSVDILFNFSGSQMTQSMTAIAPINAPATIPIEVMLFIRS